MKILIVDDDPGTLNALRIGLISFGYNIMATQSGMAALAEIKKCEGSTDPVDLLVTDFRMPEMDGLELIKEAKKISPDLLTMLITGYGNEDLQEESDRLGVNAYIEKPFTPNLLKQTILNIINRAPTFNFNINK